MFVLGYVYSCSIYTDHNKGSHGLPGLYFKYDVAALKVLVQQDREHVLQFIVRLCSIIAGIVVISGRRKPLFDVLVLIITCWFIIFPHRHCERIIAVPFSLFLWRHQSSGYRQIDFGRPNCSVQGDRARWLTEGRPNESVIFLGSCEWLCQRICAAVKHTKISQLKVVYWSRRSVLLLEEHNGFNKVCWRRCWNALSFLIRFIAKCVNIRFQKIQM